MNCLRLLEQAIKDIVRVNVMAYFNLWIIRGSYLFAVLINLYFLTLAYSDLTCIRVYWVLIRLIFLFSKPKWRWVSSFLTILQFRPVAVFSKGWIVLWVSYTNCTMLDFLQQAIASENKILFDMNNPGSQWERKLISLFIHHSTLKELR